ncbi:sensor histidine kinase [Ideonella sp. B7]|uniref:ATP-binding protein n=1 Tax=Ideonella benzenivorans TaxID=2831643 RepID=UPI001CED7AA7|nr:ATP-binding protein [Ideonella benzenivorans]MCA6217051.1 sensor histidine kinase [Ideonella benzenivorans]
MLAEERGEAAVRVPVAQRWRQRRSLVAGLAALVIMLMSGWAGFTVSVQRGTEQLRAESNHQLDLFAAAVQGMVLRLEPLPATIQLSTEVQALLRQPGSAARAQAASTYLRRLNAHLGGALLFVQDQRGTVLAASDPALVGDDLSFRPYFLEALSGRVGRHFAIGVRDGLPGYYVSHPIHDGPKVVGVAVLKIGLDPVGEAWGMLGSPALLADSNQVVILSSRPEWTYTALAELPLERRVDLQLSRLYGDHRITRFPLQVDLRVDEDSQIVEGVLPAGLGASGPGGRMAANRGMLVLGRTLDGTDWRLLMFANLQPVRAQAAQDSLLAGVSAGFVLLLMLLVNQRRRIVQQKLQLNAQLEDQVARRTQALSDTNVRLRKEVRERQQAEHTLREAQDELVHAGKMAALGQLATGITHELTQPLGAIRTLSGNAVAFMERGQLDAVSGNLRIMARLAEQMGAIIEPLKGFARKSKAQPQAAVLATAVRNALFLYDQRLRSEGVAVHDATAGLPLAAWCDPNRLEQVLINLIGNALDAMRDQPQRALWIDAFAQDGRVALRVRDQGPGLDPAVRDRVFEPFFSTKAAGGGLGLGLAISRDIAREAGGELEADNHPDGGACFTLWLPPVPTPTAP